MTFTISLSCPSFFLRTNSGVEWLIGQFTMLTGSLMLPLPHAHTMPLSSRKVVFHSVASIFYGPHSTSAKTFTGLLIMSWYCMKVAVQKSTLLKPDTSHQSTDPGCLDCVSFCCSVCLCCKECIYVTVHSITACTRIIFHLSELIQSGNDYLALKGSLAPELRWQVRLLSSSWLCLLPELIKGVRLLVFEQSVFCQDI